MAGTSPDARPVRSFVAVEVEEPARAAIVAYLDSLKTRIEDVAWTRPENLHVTLKFLGGVAPELLPTLTERLTAIGARVAPFSIGYAGVGAFPSATRPRVLWIGADAPALSPLAATVDAAGALVGGAPEDHAFHPHVTLGRPRVRRGGRAHRAATGAVLAGDRSRDFGSAPARAIVLFRSDTGPTGARHTPLARIALVG